MSGTLLSAYSEIPSDSGQSSSTRAMNHSNATPVTIMVDAAHSVCGLLMVPARARACYLLAHGAGAGMAHPFMHAVASGLAEHEIATLRYQFPYMEAGGKRPDPPELAHATVRAAASQAGRLAPALPLVAGGKSFGGRMTSQAQAASPLPGVLGLAFLGFPLHPAKRPSEERAKHLFDVRVPMLFLQGARDQLADTRLLSSVTRRLGERASLHLIADADHSFHVPARAGRKDTDVRSEMLDALVAWTLSVVFRSA
jgi:predicted alpha/beta-hydrolase family hydrolase